MKWHKKGIVFSPDSRIDWMKSHAQVPTAFINQAEGVVRVYFSSRPNPTTSLTGFVDLDLTDLANIVYVHPVPILPLGGPGSFDEHGIMPSSIVEAGGLIYLYYSGWSRGHSLPYSNYTGLAISEDGGKTFEKFSKGPVLDRTPFEIYSATSPHVMRTGKTWHMWYTSGTHWHKINDKYEHTYDIKYASSMDGCNWLQTNTTVIAQETPMEALARPTVIKVGDLYHMWFCYRGSVDFRGGGNSYRIGHAYSADLQSWQRTQDDYELNPSTAGWDSDMTAYPNTIFIDGKIGMFYNGNQFGHDGFGYATLSDHTADRP